MNVEDFITDVRTWLVTQADREQMESDNFQARAANCVEGTAAETYQRLSAKHLGKAVAFRNTLAFIDLTEAVHDRPPETVGEVEAMVAEDMGPQYIETAACVIRSGDYVRRNDRDYRVIDTWSGPFADGKYGCFMELAGFGTVGYFTDENVQKRISTGVWPVEVAAGTVDHP